VKNQGEMEMNTYKTNNMFVSAKVVLIMILIQMYNTHSLILSKLITIIPKLLNSSNKSTKIVTILRSYLKRIKIFFIQISYHAPTKKARVKYKMSKY
jgi:hypothetical protein